MDSLTFSNINPSMTEAVLSDEPPPAYDELNTASDSDDTTVSLTFTKSSVTNTVVSYSDDLSHALYEVKTQRSGLRKKTCVYREPGLVTVGQIEHHSMTPDIVTSHDGQSLRPSSASSAGFGETTVIWTQDGCSYTWKWNRGLGWRLWDAREREIATFSLGPATPTRGDRQRLPILTFPNPLAARLQDEVVLSIVYLEQRRRQHNGNEVGHDRKFTNRDFKKANHLKNMENIPGGFFYAHVGSIAGTPRVIYARGNGSY